MNVDKLIGQKVVALRSTRKIGQKELLDRLSAQGIEWSQTILSKVENGSRPIRFVEALGLAEALGVLVTELRPAGDALERIQQRSRWALKQTSDGLQVATWEYTDAVGRAQAVQLARELNAGSTTQYSVHGSAKQFCDLVIIDNDEEFTSDIDIYELLKLIGIPEQAVDNAAAALSEQVDTYINDPERRTPPEWEDTDIHWLLEGAHKGDIDIDGRADYITKTLFEELALETLLKTHLPTVSFEPEPPEHGPIPPFTVDGIHNPVDDLKRMTDDDA